MVISFLEKNFFRGHKSFLWGNCFGLLVMSTLGF